MSYESLNHQAASAVREAVGSTGVSQAELGARVGSAGSAVSRALSGRQNLTLGTIQRYLDAVGMTGRLVVTPSAPGGHNTGSETVDAGPSLFS